MTDEQNITAGVALLVAAFLLWVIHKCIKETRGTSRNIRKVYRDVLPPPSPNCQRTTRLAEPN